jgi:HAD superfamily phosphoserine phosphatase-like hydrolase
MVLLSPILLSFKLGFLPNWKAKEMVLTYFFKGEMLEDFKEKCEVFSEQVLPKLIRAKALNQLQKYQEEKIRIVIVTASAEEWVKPWCDAMKVEYISSYLETTNGKLTGKLHGRNCHGYEKVSRINSTIDLHQYDNIFAFGDSKGDMPMLNLSTKSHYKPFR